MTVEAPQTPQAPVFQPEVQEGRTPEEIMVTLLAQTIIMSSMPAPKQETAERPFEMDKFQEKTQEKAKDPVKESTKSSEKESVKPQEKQAEKTRDAQQMRQPESRSEKQLAREMPKSEKPSTQSRTDGRPESQRSSNTFQPLAQPTLIKPNVPPPPQEARLHSEHSKAHEEHGTSRRAMPQPPRHNNPASDPIFERKVDKDREQNPKKKPSFIRGRAKKIAGSVKVERVASKHFTPPARSDYESFLRIMMQDSELSDFFGVRVSHFDVMTLFIELMKLEVNDNHEERVSRLEERRYQITWMEGVVKQYKSQAKFLLFAGVGAGVLGVLSGALPIIGHVGGDFMLSKLSMVYQGFNGMKRAKVFDNISKMCFSMSEMNKAMGQVQSSFCEGERSWAEHKSSLHRTDGEESTRSIEERTREFKTWSDILAQLLRMEQDLVKQLYQ